MAIWTNNWSNGFSRTGLPSSITTAAFCCWVKLDSVGDWQCCVSLDRGSGNGERLYIETNNGSPQAQVLYGRNSLGDEWEVGWTQAATGWQFLAGVYNSAAAEGTVAVTSYGLSLGGTAAQWASNSETDTGINANGNFGTTPGFYIGWNSIWDEPVVGRVANVKLWIGSGANLSSAQMFQEMYSFRPLQRTGLYAWYPLVGNTATNCALDWSGNGNNLTVNGSPTVQDGPPVSWGGRPVIIPASMGATVYDETGRQLSATVTIVAADAQTYAETARPVTGVASVLEADAQTYLETDRPIDAVVTVDVTDQMGGYTLSGVTKDDATGDPVGSCDVYIWKRSGDSLTFVGFTTSDPSTGAYSLTGIADGDAAYLATAWKTAAERLMDATDCVLQPAA